LDSKALAFSAASPWNSADESADQAGDLRPAVGIELSRFFWDRERAVVRVAFESQDDRS